MQSPYSNLSDFRDQWVLVWVGKDGQLFYGETEVDDDGIERLLTAKTAIHYIKKHLQFYSKILQDEGGLRRKSSEGGKKRKSSDFSLAFDKFEAGKLKKSKITLSEDNMRDMLETDEERALYDVHMKLKGSSFFQIPQAAEPHLSYFS